MKTIARAGLLAAVALSVVGVDAAARGAAELRRNGIAGGVAIVLDARDATQLSALSGGGAFLVHGLVRDASQMQSLRDELAKAGDSGPVTAGLWDGSAIPLVAGTVSVIVSSGAEVTGEMRRVLAPYGIVVSPGGREQWRKPWPTEMDEWTHYLHGPSNNAVGQDSVVGSPRHLKWLAGPDMLRHHDHLPSLNAMVTSRGKLFYIFDEASPASILFPAKWKLIARDAFNGVLLWKKPINEWHPHLWPLKSMPATLPRRLVSVGESVYVTLGITAPVSELNAADGKVRRVFAGTEKCEEIVVAGDVLLAVCLRGKGPLDDTDKENMKFMDPRATKFPLARRLASGITSPMWLHAERSVVACDLVTGRELWRHDTKCAPLTLAADGKRVYFHDSESVVALDRRGGRQLWKSEAVPVWELYHGWFGASLVVHDDVVIFAGGEGMTWYIMGTPKGANDTMTAFSAADGKKLWTAEHPPSGYRSPEDLFVAQGLVWAGDYTHKSSHVLKGRDPTTGEVEREYKVSFGHGFHHRCHPSKATEKYLIAAKVGTNLVSFEREYVDNNQWIRGACGFGIMPANGVIYAPPDPCNCYPESKLNGFAAAATPEHVGERVDTSARLLQGPAYATGGRHLKGADADDPDSWPTYRHDAARSGTTTARPPAALAVAWRKKVGANISAPVVASGKAYVADIDASAVVALDLDSGRELWRYAAGGRVDSPPTVVGERLYFGSADGMVTCLTAAGGELVWRFRAAPADDLMVNEGRLESVWPVHGSVTYHNGLIYAVAGRSKFVDGGLNLVALDPATGTARVEERGALASNQVRGMDAEVAMTDVLSARDDRIFMRSMSYDLDLKRAGGAPKHVFSSNGFLDGRWFHRSFWIHGSRFAGGCGGFGKTGNSNIAGRIMVADGEKIYSFGRTKYGWGSAFTYKIHMTDTAASAPPEPAPAKKGKKKRRRKSPKPKAAWSVDAPILVRGMIKTPDVLFIAGPRKLYDESEIIQQLDDAGARQKVAEQAEALQTSAELLAISPEDGSELSRLDLGGMLVWDGMAAVGTSIVVSMRDGSVVRLRSRGR
jgi:outer membrane protein assembly factor BamB